VRQRFHRALAVLRKQRPFVTAVGDDAGRMCHQLAQGHGPLLLGERGDVRLILGVELQAAFFQ
jgi:hypothetical protein